MKKLIILVIGVSRFYLSQAQVSKNQYIDSIDSSINTQHVILLFSELNDTTDAYTHEKFRQRISYYYDWRAREIRLIDVYRFDEIPKARAERRSFRKQRNIPSGNEIRYAFSGNNLIKVTITPSGKQCLHCLAEYYFFNDEVIYKNEVHFSQQLNNSTMNGAFFLERLARLRIIRKGHDDLLTNQ